MQKWRTDPIEAMERLKSTQRVKRLRPMYTTVNPSRIIPINDDIFDLSSWNEMKREFLLATSGGVGAVRGRCGRRRGLGEGGSEAGEN